MHVLLAHIAKVARRHSCCIHTNASGHTILNVFVGTQCSNCAYGNTQSQRGIGACRIWSNSDNWAKRPGHDEADNGFDTDADWQVLTI